jgi:carboxymethylenebutenolidase
MAPPPAANEHAEHTMTAAEHVAHMAAAGNIHAGHAMEELKWGVMQAAAPNLSLPADDMGAKDRLARSPRKGEFVKIDVGGTPVTTWVVRPQGQAKAPVVVVIQEVFGLSDWIRGVADQLAAEGFIAVAPDLLSGHGPNSGDSSSFAGQQEMVQATLMLPAAEIIARIKAAREWGLKLPQANGKSGSVGFCFGGNQSFNLAVAEPSLNAAVVYYGTAPTDAPPAAGGARGGPGGPAPAFVPSDRLSSVKAPVLGLYGGLMQDARIGNTLAATEAKMKELGKAYEPHIFDGAAHGFLRAQTGNEGANMKAAQQAWPLTVAWLKKYAS